MDPFDIEATRSSAFFKGIDTREFQKICSVLSPVVRSYQKGEVIIRQGDVVKQIGIVMEGRIQEEKYHYDGNTQLLRMIGSRDIIGLEAVSSSFLTSPCMLTAASDCIVAFFTYQEFFQAPQINSSCRQIIWQNVINIMADENIRKMYKIDVLSKRTLRERIITHLSIIREKRGVDTFDIGMNQEQFAQYLCVNRSVLSKELNRMRKEGLIDFKKSVYTILIAN